MTTTTKTTATPKVPAGTKEMSPKVKAGSLDVFERGARMTARKAALLAARD